MNDLPPDERPPHAGTQGLGPVLSAGYGGAFTSLGKTWLASLPTVVLMYAVSMGSALLIVALAFGWIFAIEAWFPHGGLGLSRPTLALVGTGAILAFAIAIVCVLLPLLAAPVQALFRAHARNILHDERLGLLDGVRGGFRSHSLNLFIAVALPLEYLGYLFFLVPGVVFSAATAFVIPGMVIHDLTLFQAIRRSVAHFLEAPVWHAGLTLIDAFVAWILNSSIPFVGLLLAMPLSTQLHLRAYLEAFPVDDEPPG